MSILHTEWLSREHDWQFQLWQRFFFIFVLFTAALQGGHASIPWDSFVKWMVEAQQKEKSSVYTDPMISHQIHKGILSVFAGWKQVALSGIGRMHAVYACWITSKQDFDSGGLRVCRLAAWEHIWCGHFLCSALPFAPLALLAFSANVLRLKTSRFQQAMHLEDKRYVRSTGRLHLLLMFLFPQRRCYKASWRSVRCCAQARWEGNLFDCSLCLVHQVTSSFLKHPCSILKTITDDSGISRVCIKDAHGFGPDVWMREPTLTLLSVLLSFLLNFLVSYRTMFGDLETFWFDLQSAIIGTETVDIFWLEKSRWSLVGSCGLAGALPAFNLGKNTVTVFLCISLNHHGCNDLNTTNLCKLGS